MLELIRKLQERKMEVAKAKENKAKNEAILNEIMGMKKFYDLYAEEKSPELESVLINKAYLITGEKMRVPEFKEEDLNEDALFTADEYNYIRKSLVKHLNNEQLVEDYVVSKSYSNEEAHRFVRNLDSDTLASLAEIVRFINKIGDSFL